MNNYENGTSSLIMQIYEKKEGKERNKISYPGTGVPRASIPAHFFLNFSSQITHIRNMTT